MRLIPFFSIRSGMLTFLIHQSLDFVFFVTPSFWVLLRGIAGDLCHVQMRILALGRGWAFEGHELFFPRLILLIWEAIRIKVLTILAADVVLEVLQFQVLLMGVRVALCSEIDDLALTLVDYVDFAAFFALQANANGDNGEEETSANSAENQEWHVFGICQFVEEAFLFFFCYGFNHYLLLSLDFGSFWRLERCINPELKSKIVLGLICRICNN